MGVFILATEWSLDPEEEDDNQGSGKPDPVRAQMKKLEKQNQELQKQLEEAKATSRKSTIKDVLVEKKLSPKLAGLIPSSVDPTPEAIEKWLEEYGDLFTPPKESKEEDTTPDAGEFDPQDVDLATVAAFNRMSKASAGATPPGKPTELLQKIMSPDLTQEQLIKMIEDAGGGFGTG